jgi:hypothetical protein
LSLFARYSYHECCVAELIDDLRRVRQAADVFGPGSTTHSIRAVAQRALEHDDEEEVRAVASRLLAELDWSTVQTRRRGVPGQ